MTKLSDTDNFSPLFEGITRDVGLAAGAVYGRMYRYAYTSGICQASNETIAQDLGISVRTVIRAQHTLIEQGYIIDKTPDLRNKPHTYTMTNKAATMSESQSDIDSTMSDCHGTVTKCQSGCDKMSLEERSKRESKREKTTAPVGADLPDSQSDIELFFDGDVPKQPSKNGEKPKLEPLDVLTHVVEQAQRRDKGEIEWMQPGTYCGDHDFLEPYLAFCAVIGRDPSTVGEHKTRQWLKRLDKIAVISPGNAETEAVMIHPSVMAQAIKAIRGDWNFEHKKWTTPFSDKFAELLEYTAAGIMSGTLVGDGQKQWSGAMA